MKLSLSELRRLIGLALTEARKGFYDAYFVGELPRVLETSPLNHNALGNLRGYGNEGIVYDYTSGLVIKFIPCYEWDETRIEGELARLRAVTSQQDIVEIHELDVIHDDDGPFAIYIVMDSLYPLTPEESRVIDAVLSNKQELVDVGNDELRSFLERYMKMNHDHDANNIMKTKSGTYKVIDHSGFV